MLGKPAANHADVRKQDGARPAEGNLKKRMFVQGRLPRGGQAGRYVQRLRRPELRQGEKNIHPRPAVAHAHPVLSLNPGDSPC